MTGIDIVVVVLRGNNLKAENKGYNKRETKHQSILCLNMKHKYKYEDYLKNG